MNNTSPSIRFSLHAYFHYLAGDISLAAERNELWSLWEGNFMDYLSMGIYRVTVTVESC
ncbi:DUF2787 family protein [Enterobacter roggenkampii]|uniref:DUF2787 family protein n=1 Tax=Enterobacter roggenkampii TaxID=1812935 RepID=UPI001E58432F|nr:DUF2787 family protein [Enterobacter roggenkampii]